MKSQFFIRGLALAGVCLMVACQKSNVRQFSPNVNLAGRDLANEGAAKPANVLVSIPNSLAGFVSNNNTALQGKGLGMPQLENHDMSSWGDAGIYPGNSVLNTHPKNFSSPRFALLKNNNGNYVINTLYILADPKGEYVREGVGQFGLIKDNNGQWVESTVKKSVIIETKGTALLGMIPAIPGQLTNGQPYADGKALSMGFIATKPGNSADWSTATPFQGRPDSMIVFFKYTPNKSDRAVFEVVFHKEGDVNQAEGRLPAVYNGNNNGYKPVSEQVVGYGRGLITAAANDDWYRAAIPIVYKDDSATVPDYALVNFTSSDLTDGVGYKLAAGSKLEIDRVVFQYGYTSSK